MAHLNGLNAINRMAAFGTYKPGRCLEAVDQAMQKPTSDRPGYYTYALRAANATPASRRYGREGLRAGMVVYLSAGPNGYGHICIATDNKGGVISTDVPYGRIGRTTIDALCRSWGRTFLFASDWLMGHSITVMGPGKGGSSSSGGSSSGSSSSGTSGNKFFPSIAKFKAIQGGYNALGYGLVVDGKVGPKTTAAVKDFQKKHGLTPDGVHGPSTEAKLAAVVAAKNKPSTKNRPLLKRGSKGQDVRDLQTILVKYHGAQIKIDGDFGVATRDALAAVQRKLGLLGDGEAGPKTWAKLGQ